MAGLNLMDMLTQANNGQGLAKIAEQFGLDQNQAQAAIGALLPALSSGLKRNVSQPGGLEALLGALKNGGHEQYIENPSKLAEGNTINDGNAILGHLLGSKEVSRAAASRASAQTGIPDDLLKKLLPVVATMAMGALSKQSKDMDLGSILTGALTGNAPQGGKGLGGGLGGLLGSLMGGKKPGASPQAGGLGGMLGNLLDADKDGSSMDDIFDMLKKR